MYELAENSSRPAKAEVVDMKFACFFAVDSFHIFEDNPKIPMESHESIWGSRNPFKLIDPNPLLNPPSLAYLEYPEDFRFSWYR